MSIAIFCGNAACAFYSNGILTDLECPSDQKPDHAVVLTGYAENSTSSYWIVRNSYGQNYGINGYVYLDIQTKACNPSFGFALELGQLK